jgi:uncharacterized membrane protein YdbT with pleckstrin-like domain
VIKVADKERAVWRDRKRPLFGLPLSFTQYCLTEEKLLAKTGMLRLREEEIRLYRILDLTLERSLFDRMFGVGTIRLCTADKSTPEFDIRKIKHSDTVKNTLSDMVEKERQKKRISGREFLYAGDGDNDGIL